MNQQDPIPAVWKVRVDRTLFDLTRRVEALELAAGRAPAPAPEPPPVIATRRPSFTAGGLFAPVQPAPFEAPHGQRPQLDDDPSYGSRVTASTDNETEYVIGAKWLPRIGAGLVVAALAYFVAWGYQKGWISAQAIFALEALFCLLFIGAGQRLREAREEYGEIVTGVGSCGLFLVIAGGHFQHQLYGVATLVGGFLAVALAHLAYGFARESKAFWVIGALGGLAAALLPLDRGDASTSAALLGIVQVTAAAITWRREWPGAACTLWAAGAAAYVVWLGAYVMQTAVGPAGWDARDPLPWALFYVLTLAPLAGWARSFRVTPFDRFALFGPAIAAGAALWGFTMQSGPTGAAHVALFSLAVIGCGFVAKATEARRSLWTVGIALPLTLAPFGLGLPDAIAVLACLALLAAVYSREHLAKAASALSGVLFVAALSAYLAWMDGAIVGNPWQTELGLLSALLVALVASGYALSAAFTARRELGLTAMCLSLPLVSRMSVVGLGVEGIGLNAMDSLSVAFVALALLGAAVSVATRWRLGLICSAGLLTVAATVSVRPIVGTSFSPAFDLAVVLGILATTLLLGAARRTGEPDEESFDGFAGFAWAAAPVLIARIAFLVTHALPEAQLLAVLLTTTACSVIACFAARRLDRAEPLAGALTSLTAGALVYLNRLSPTGVGAGETLAYVSAFGLAAAYLVATFARRSEQPEIAWTLGALAGWPVATVWFQALLSATETSGGVIANASFGWTLYAAGLLASGFIWRAPALRYFSFAVMGATAGKILVLDLVAVEPAVRVGVLLALGLAMLIAGYVYVRGRPART